MQCSPAQQKNISPPPPSPPPHRAREHNGLPVSPSLTTACGTTTTTAAGEYVTYAARAVTGLWEEGCAGRASAGGRRRGASAEGRWERHSREKIKSFFHSSVSSFQVVQEQVRLRGVPETCMRYAYKLITYIKAPQARLKIDTKNRKRSSCVPVKPIRIPIQKYEKSRIIRVHGLSLGVISKWDAERNKEKQR